MEKISWEITKEEKIDIGKRVKEVRDAQNLTQREFAEELERTQNHISRIETGENLITTELVLKLYHLYGTDIQYLLTGKTSNGVAHGISHFVEWYGSLALEEERYGADRFCETIMDIYRTKPAGE